jgi:hypothetical protein
MGGCAYCGSNAPLTREHLWPAALHQRLANAREDKSSVFWLAKINKVIPNEPTVRDVCANCNNGILSALDGYICELFDRSFVTILKRYERLEFEYDYHRLKRCLLKICYNSARIHGRSVQLFCQLAYPAEVPDEFLEPMDERPARHSPRRPCMVRSAGHRKDDA